MTKAKANKGNSRQSTGPRTVEGKAVVAGNALQHGILSAKLFLAGESQEDFFTLTTELTDSLRPVGALEVALVEKIAVALWRQRRLVTAETARIEIDRHLPSSGFLTDLGAATGAGGGSELLDKPETHQIRWCKKALAEFDEVSNLETVSAEYLEKNAPTIYGQLIQDAEAGGADPQAYLSAYEGKWEFHGTYAYLSEMRDWCESELATQQQRAATQEILPVVQASRSCADELFARYQVAMDGDLYRAMRALRETQEWRLKRQASPDIELEAEVIG